MSYSFISQNLFFSSFAMVFSNHIEYIFLSNIVKANTYYFNSYINEIFIYTFLNFSYAIIWNLFQ